MQFRSLLALGFGASLLYAGSAFAARPVPVISAPVPEQVVVEVATKAEQEALKKKKAAEAKKTSNGKTVAKPQTEQEKTAAKAKADKEKAAEAKLAKAQAAKAERAKKLEVAKLEREKKLAAAKADREKKAAAAKLQREKMMADRAKAAEERKVRFAKAAEERKLAREQATQQRRQVAEAKVRAAEERKLAKVRADEVRREQVAAAAEADRRAEMSRLASMDIVQTGNNGELRSETSAQAAPKKSAGLFAGLFGGQQPAPRQVMLPETRALDAAMEQRAAKKPFKLRPEYEAQVVDFSGYPKGTIVVDTGAHFLYLVESSSKARRYGIAVGKEGLQYKGTVAVGDKQEWPRWIPTKEMIGRDPQKYGQYADGMPGGGANPLGARAIYLYKNGRDTYLRIHGTIAPESIGTNASNGCFRMVNDAVIDLYRRVPVGANVVVL